MSRQHKYYRNVQRKIFVALNVVKQNSNRFCSLCLFSCISARAEGLVGGNVCFGCTRKTEEKHFCVDGEVKVSI